MATLAATFRFHRGHVPSELPRLRRSRFTTPRTTPVAPYSTQVNITIPKVPAGAYVLQTVYNNPQTNYITCSDVTVL